MPDLNGVEVVRQIRAVIGEGTPIILTAYDWTEIEEEARKAGVTAFCAKPLFLSDLYEVLNASVEAEPMHPGKAKSNLHLKGSRILLVEDNDLNREIAPEIGGRIRAWGDPALSAIPILAMTANAFGEGTRRRSAA